MKPRYNVTIRRKFFFKMAVNSSGKRTLMFHLFCLLINIVGCSYDLFYVKLDSFQTYGGRFKFLTHCSQYLHAIFLAYATGVNLHIFCDGLAKGNAQQPRKGFGIEKSDREEGFLARFRDHFFVVVCFPLGIMVCVLFWGIVMVKPDGLMTSENRKVMPLSGLYNQYLHTFPLFLDLAAVYWISHRYPKRLLGISLVMLMSLSYLTWLVHVGNHTGVWVYPFLQHQTRFEFTVFMICAMAGATAVYVMGEKISALIWRKESTKSF